MIKIFGDEYRRYMERTSMFIPRVKKGDDSMSIKKVSKGKGLSCKCHQSC